MNILFVTDWFHMFANSDTGASNRSTMFVKALAELGHVDVISFASDSEKSNVDNCDVIFSSSSVSCPRHASSSRLLKYLHLLMPWDSSYYYPVCTEKERIIDTVVSTHTYDYIACRYYHEAVQLGLLKYSSRLLLDLDDGPAKCASVKAHDCWISQTSWMNKIYNRIVVYSIAVAAFLDLRNIFKTYYSNPNNKPFYKSIFLHNVAINQCCNPPVDRKQENRLIFVGQIDYYPNLEGVTHFLDKIYPNITDNVPDVSLHIVGKLANSKIKEYWESKPNVKVMGYIRDLEQEYAEAKVAIIPLYAGGGTSIKLLEAMNMKRPCVSTPKGVRGFDFIFKPGTHYLLGRNDKDFAEKVILLLNDENLANTIAYNAQSAVDCNLSSTRFCEIIRNSLAND